MLKGFPENVKEISKKAEESLIPRIGKTDYTEQKSIGNKEESV